MRFTPRDTGSSWNYAILDFSGGLVGWDRPAIVASSIDWWNTGCGCYKDPEWNMWVCEWTAERDVAYLDFRGWHRPTSAFIARFSQTELGLIETHRHVGYVCRSTVDEPEWYDEASLSGCMLLTRNWGNAGGANAIWHYRFFGGPDAPLGRFNESVGGMVESASPSSFLISETNIMRGRFIVVALAYPPGTTFTVTAHLHGRDFPIAAATSQDDVLAPTEQLLDPRVDPFPADVCADTLERPQWGQYEEWAVCALNATAARTGPSWYFNASTGMLYVRVVNLKSHIGVEMYDPTLPERLVTARNGMRLGEITRDWQYRINASCSGPYGMCLNGRHVPGASRSHGDSCTTTQQRTWVGWGFGNSVMPPRHDLARLVLCGASSDLWEPPVLRRGVLWPDLARVRLARRGDRLSFTSSTGHDLVQLPSRAAYDACDLSAGVTLYTFQEWAYAFELNLTAAGILYLVCGQADHCVKGQKIIVHVSATEAGPPGAGADAVGDAPILEAHAGPMYQLPSEKATCIAPLAPRHARSACPGSPFPEPDNTYVTPSPPSPPPEQPPTPPISPPISPPPPVPPQSPPSAPSLEPPPRLPAPSPPLASAPSHPSNAPLPAYPPPVRSSPPPYPPTRSGESVIDALATLVTFSLTIQGDAASFDDTARGVLTRNLADALGCVPPACLLELRLGAPASIQVDVTIIVPQNHAGSADVSSVVTSAATELVTRPPAALSNALGVVVLGAKPVQVSHTVSVTLVVAPPPPPASPVSSLPSPTLIAAVAAGGLAGVLVAMLRCYFLRSRRHGPRAQDPRISRRGAVKEHKAPDVTAPAAVRSCHVRL